MPLDPNIFFRGAELQANNAARTQATVQNFFDKLSAQKQKQLDLEKAKETDYEGSAYRVLMAQQAGIEPDPADLRRAQAWDTMQTSQNAINPATGEPYPKNASIFGTLKNSPAAPYQPTYAPPVMTPDIMGPPAPYPTMNMPAPGNRPVMNDIGLGNVNDAVLPPLGDNAIEVSGGVTPEMRDSNRGLPAPSNPKQAQTTFEAATDLAKSANQADIDASKAGAEKRSTLEQENAVNTEQRLKAMKEIQGNLESLLKDAKGTPSGAIEGAAASATSWAGVPNDAALKRARFESGKAISGLQTRIAFLKGQGTITDAEAAQAMAFIPSPNDPYEIKIERLQGGIDYIKEITGQKPAPAPSASKPGFRYLGSE